MKKLNNYRFILLLGVLLFASCTDERYEVNDSRPTGETVEVPLTFTVDKMLNIGENDIPLNGDGLLTRTIPGDLDGNDGASAEVKKMTILQFNELDFFIRKSDATLGAGGAISVNLTECTGTSKVIVLANPPAKFSAVVPELGERFEVVAKKVLELTQESDLYYMNPDDSKNYLFMSDIATIDFAATPTPPLNLTFKRNVARVNLSLELNSFTLKSVRLRNIPTKMLLVDQVSEKQGLVPYDTSTGENIFPFESSLLDYDVITDFTDYLNAGKYSFSWYVPRNEQGIITAAASKEKTKEKKPYATYFEIVVEDNTGYQATFSIVPGANNITDYNLKPNKVYNTSLKIAGLGEDDDRISNVTTFEGYSNSYILNPPAVGTRTFVIPIKQVYKYWKGTSAGYGNTPSLLAGTWEVSHLWSDVTASGVSISTDSGSFSDESTDAFEVKVESSATNGNYVVALKAGGKILWSWHLWVTDYNPDAFTGPVDQAVYKYKVNGGYVDRYGGTGWTTGEFKSAVMMDRNLGALKERPEYVPGASGQLFYQFGRKDPFLESNATKESVTTVGVPISKSVYNPRTFYTGTVSWTSDGVMVSNYNWFDSAASGVGVKSIYDPCPEGWVMPRGKLGNLHTDFTGTKYKRIQDGTDSEWDKVRGIEYRPNEGTEVVWYPATGYLSSGTGTFSKDWSPGTYWTANYYSDNKAWRYNLGPAAITDGDSAITLYGEPVRCVKLDAVN